MRSFSRLLCLLWSPWLIKASLSIVVETDSNGALQPGETLTYVVSGSPIPSGTLGIVLIPVEGSDPNAPRAYIPSSMTMAFSPTSRTLAIPSDMGQAFYTVDVHANTSVYSPLLASSNVFEIAPAASVVAPTTVVKQTTTQVVVQQPTTTTTAANTPTTTNTPAAAASSSAASVGGTTAKSNTNAATASSGTASAPSNPAASSADNAASATSPQASSGSSSSGAAASTGGSAETDTTPASKKSSSALGPAIGGAIGGIIIILLLLFLWRRRAARNKYHQDGEEGLDSATQYHDPADGPSTSPFSNAYREFSPNRPMTQVSPFVLDSEVSSGPASPEQGLYTAKYREAFGGSGSGSGMHAQNHHSISSSGYLDSSAASDAPPELLRNERERLLGEISALRSRGGQSSAYAESSVGSSSARGEDESLEMRNRLDMLTQHVQRLESALEQAVNVYDAPPVYHQAPSQRFSSR